MGSMPEIQKPIDFLVANAKKSMKYVEKDVLKGYILELEKNIEHGLNYEDLERLATEVVFTFSYDLTTRRKLLYCLIPENDFPYKIVPRAISHCMVVPVNLTWQFSVLSWLCSLLEYSIIDPYHSYVHLCYSSVFNLTSKLNLVLLACKILGYMTTMEDVTVFRANILMHLKEKPGYFEKVSQLLRTYQLFRPDLVFGKLSFKHFPHSAPRNLKKGLLALRARAEDSGDLDIISGGSNIWPEFNKAERVNPYSRSTAIPRPDNVYYAGTMEEKTEKKIFVSQYRRFGDFIKGLPHMEHWKWPNNPASHLCSPVLIPLFRPNDMTVMISITNWLQVALRIELIEGFGNLSKERRQKLLKAVYMLVKVTGTHIPVINDFLSEYFCVWDKNSDFTVMMSLLEHVTYTSYAFVSETYLKLIAELLDHAPLVMWCKVVEAVSNTAGSWAIQAYKESAQGDLANTTLWPCKTNVEFDSAIVGLWFLVSRMERFFSAALVEYDYHPMVFHHILDFYLKINMYSEQMNLPAFFQPPVPFTLAVLTQSDLAVSHRLGKLLGITLEATNRIRGIKVYGPEIDVRSECMSMCATFNLSVRIFMAGIYRGSAFGKVFIKSFNQFYSSEFLQKMLSAPLVRRFASVAHALPYLPYYADSLVKRDIEELNEEDAKSLINKVIENLENDGFYGIRNCVDTYKKKSADDYAMH